MDAAALKDRIETLEKVLQQHLANANAIHGAIEELKFWLLKAEETKPPEEAP